MSQGPAHILHQQKIQMAKRKLESRDGKMIKEHKIQEWALLEIAEKLQDIHSQLILLNVPRPSVSGLPPLT